MKKLNVSKSSPGFEKRQRCSAGGETCGSAKVKSTGSLPESNWVRTEARKEGAAERGAISMQWLLRGVARPGC